MPRINIETRSSVERRYPSRGGLLRARSPRRDRCRRVLDRAVRHNARTARGARRVLPLCLAQRATTYVRECARQVLGALLVVVRGGRNGPPLHSLVRGNRDWRRRVRRRQERLPWRDGAQSWALRHQGATRLCHHFEQSGRREDRDIVAYMRDLKARGIDFDKESSGAYTPLGPDDFKRLCLGKPTRKTKETPMIQIADLVLFPMAKAGSRAGWKSRFVAGDACARAPDIQPSLHCIDLLRHRSTRAKVEGSS